MPLTAVKSTADQPGEVCISAGSVVLTGELLIPDEATGVVMFAHGSGSSRFSPRNQYVAHVIRDAGVGTLLFDLLTPEEEAVDIQTRHLRFDISLLAQRLVDRSGFFKQVRGAWNNFQLLLAAKLRQRLLIHVNHLVVSPTNN